jgi:hypothetical protein
MSFTQKTDKLEQLWEERVLHEAKVSQFKNKLATVAGKWIVKGSIKWMETFHKDWKQYISKEEAIQAWEQEFAKAKIDNKTYNKMRIELYRQMDKVYGKK